MTYKGGIQVAKETENLGGVGKEKSMPTGREQRAGSSRVKRLVRLL